MGLLIGASVLTLLEFLDLFFYEILVHGGKDNDDNDDSETSDDTSENRENEENRGMAENHRTENHVTHVA